MSGFKSPSQNVIANCELRIANWFNGTLVLVIFKLSARTMPCCESAMLLPEPLKAIAKMNADKYNFIV